MPKISVIIPVYNVEQCLRECLDSVANQTHRDLEIICVNDGSTDGSLSILEEYAAKDSRFIILTKENNGPSAARNMSLERVTGEYIAFCDSDDRLDLTAYEKALIRAQESDADLTQFSFNLVEFQNSHLPQIPRFDETADVYEKVKLVYNNWHVCWCYLWKTSFIKKNNLRFHDDLKSNDEITFTYKGAIVANKIAILHERLYYYRFRPSSLTGNKKGTSLLQRPVAYTLLFEDIADCNISDKVRFFLFFIKWKGLWDTYYTVIHKCLRSKFRKQICSHILDGEFELLKSHSDELDFRYVSFFTMIYSQSSIERLRMRFAIMKYWFKCTKGRFFDWLAKRLIPYSPWLQMTCQAIESQRKEIQELSKSKEENNA